MERNTLWSLRLGFSGKQAELIKKEGIADFLKDSFSDKVDKQLPGFLKDSPKTLAEIQAYKQGYKDITDGRKKENAQFLTTSYNLRGWWVDKMRENKYPLREKLVVFWHNHYVSAISKYRVPYWAYTHNMVLRENAFGNIKDLTKKILRTNAMVYYLDNNKNRNGRFNENLSRELLELFTLGVGNYTEQDIKNGARGLAGLFTADNGAAYNPKMENTDPFTYFGKTGNFKSDEMVDIIFSQKKAPYFITRKLLKWFIYDNPPEALVTYYGDYLREMDYEMQPFLTKLFTEEFSKDTAGSKIKDPLVYMLQLLDELTITNQNSKLIAAFVSNQGMDLFNQPNVKGWDGGNSWLTAQLYLKRNTTADNLCKGRNVAKINLTNLGDPGTDYNAEFDVKPEWKKAGDNKAVIAQLRDRLLCSADEQLQKDFENILKHDFDAGSKSADMAVLALVNYMVKTPEFQLI